MKIFRIVIDITMYILFVLLMGHHIIDELPHEVLGTILFTLFIIHNILNYIFYKSIFKGKYRYFIFINNDWYDNKCSNDFKGSVCFSEY